MVTGSHRSSWRQSSVCARYSQEKSIYCRLDQATFLCESQNVWLHADRRHLQLVTQDAEMAVSKAAAAQRIATTQVRRQPTVSVVPRYDLGHHCARCVFAVFTRPSWTRNLTTSEAQSRWRIRKGCRSSTLCSSLSQVRSQLRFLPLTAS